MKSFVAEVGAIPPASLRGNSRAHWGAKARDAKTWRTSGRWHGYVEGIAMRHVPRVSVHYAFHHWRKIDRENVEIGKKTGPDGRVEGGVVEGGDMPAAGALLTQRKRVPRGELWAGRPARMMRRLAPEEWEQLSRTAANYAERAQQFLRQMREVRP